MADAGRGGDGKYTTSVSDAEIIAALEQASGPVVTAAELEDVLPIGRRAIRERLLGLLDQGRVDRKKVGGRAVVWWLVRDEGPTGNNQHPRSNDPVFDLPTFASDRRDVSANVDAYVADAIAGESDPDQ